GEAKHSPVDVRGDEADRLDNQIDVFGKTFLGLTVACARCHDHKFDPISTRDYYALCGYLQSSRYQRAFIDAPERATPLIQHLADLRGGANALAVELTARELTRRLESLGTGLMDGSFRPAPADPLWQAWTTLAEGKEKYNPQPFTAQKLALLRSL